MSAMGDDGPVQLGASHRTNPDGLVQPVPRPFSWLASLDEVPVRTAQGEGLATVGRLTIFGEWGAFVLTAGNAAVWAQLAEAVRDLEAAQSAAERAARLVLPTVPMSPEQLEEIRHRSGS